MTNGGGTTPIGTAIAGRRARRVSRDAVVTSFSREVRLQGQHYFSIALGAIIAAGGIAMLTHSPRAAADGHPAASTARQESASSSSTDKAVPASAVVSDHR